MLLVYDSVLCAGLLFMPFFPKYLRSIQFGCEKLILRSVESLYYKYLIALKFSKVKMILYIQIYDSPNCQEIFSSLMQENDIPKKHAAEH